MSNDSPEPTIEVRNNAAANQYEVLVDGVVAGFARYRMEDAVRIFHETEIGAEYGGRGLGGRLARGAMDEMRAGGEQVAASCPFIRNWVGRNPDYLDVIDQAKHDSLG